MGHFWICLTSRVLALYPPHTYTHTGTHRHTQTHTYTHAHTLGGMLTCKPWICHCSECYVQLCMPHFWTAFTTSYKMPAMLICALFVGHMAMVRSLCLVQFQRKKIANDHEHSLYYYNGRSYTHSIDIHQFYTSLS